MQDLPKENPSQPIFNRAHRPADDSNLEADDSEYEPVEIQLPPRGLFYAFIVGGLGGLVAALLHIAITFINAPLYNQAVRLGDKMSSNMAGTIVGLGCLNAFVDLALSFVVGYIVGRLAVQRRLGALAGALFGAIIYLVGFVVQYLPNNPARIVSNNPSSSGLVFGGILIVIIVLAVYSSLGALLALWGAWAATRRDPYYQQQSQE